MAESLGRYTLLRRVAAGGMAEIWKAKALGPAGFQKTVAIKRILPHLVEETEFIQMFIEEAKLAAELVHPNIIQVFDFGQLGANDYFIAMEYVSGPSLARLLKRVAERSGSFPAICALYVVAESAKGLGHAHAKTDELGIPLGIVHRDVSPQNLLVSYAGDVKVGDFGIAKAAGAVNRTQEGQVRGKLSYMSPEQANGRKGIDGRSDLFSLGVVLYELLTGRRLFPSNLTTVEAYGRVAGFRGLDLEDLAAVPAPFRDLVGKALRAEPEDRFQDGNEFELACTTMLGSKGIARAREQLASMVQSLFDEEKKIEMTPVPAGNEIQLGSENPVVVGSLSGPASVGAAPFVPAETVKSPILPLQMPTPTSGLTLASTKMPIQAKQVSKVSQFPPVPKDISVGVSVEEPAKRFSPAIIGALAGGLALLVVAFGVAAKIAGFGGAAGAGSVAVIPSPVGTAAATSTPEASATATAAATPTVAPTATQVAMVASPVATKAPAPKGFGLLSVTSRPWVQVWVDNKMVKPETPLTAHKLTAGRHWIRFVNPGLGFDETRMITVQPDGSTTIQIDVKSKAITVR